MTDHRLVALIPARSGSKRIAGKNTRILAGHPLLAYAIATAQESGIFARIVVSTDSRETADLAEQYGASPILRPAEMATDYSPDIEWVIHALDVIGDCEALKAFAILRPTSPFRRGGWVSAAWDHLERSQGQSIRAMRPVTEHPAKMWRVGQGEWVASPLLPFATVKAPWHSMPIQELPVMYVQTAALEIAYAGIPYAHGTIAGDRVTAWLCESDSPESLDINTIEDFERAERMAAAHPEYLPPVQYVPILAAAGGWQ